MKRIILILTVGLSIFTLCLDAKPRIQSKSNNRSIPNRTSVSFSQSAKKNNSNFTKRKALQQKPKVNSYKISQSKPQVNKPNKSSFSNKKTSYKPTSFRPSSKEVRAKPNRQQYKPKATHVNPPKPNIQGKPHVNKRPNLHPEPPYRPRPQPLHHHHHSHGSIAPIIISSAVSALSYLSTSAFDDTSVELTASEEAQILQQRLQNTLIQSSSRLNIHETFSISVEVLKYQQLSYNERYAQVEVVIYCQNSGRQTTISAEGTSTYLDDLVNALAEKIIQATY